MVGDCCNIRRLVFLVFWPVTHFEERRWHFDYLRNQGFEVEVFDLTYLLNRESILKHPVPHALHGGFIRHINTYQELNDLLGAYAGNSLFVDYLVGPSDISLKTEKIFRLLKKHQARYTFISAGALPLPASTLGVAKSLAAMMRRAVSPLKLWNFIASKLIVTLSKHELVYPLPFIIFGGHSEVLQRYISKRNIGKEKVIPTHSFDYDTYLYYRRSQDDKAVPTENICVFLDEAITHHSDFGILGLKPINAEEYFSSINQFFDFVEKTTGLQVVIAAHPRSDYELMPDVFEGRSIIKGKTVELTAKSSMVVMHGSTSVSFAILFNKPVVSVKTADISANSYLNTLIDTMAAAIGVQPVNVDKDRLVPSLLNGNIDQKKYEAYLYKYIKSPEAEDRLVWEIIASVIKKLKLTH